MSPVAKAARDGLKPNVNSIKPAARAATPSFRPADFLSIQYQAFPKPLDDAATLYPTREIAADDSHPLFPRIKQRIDSFDPNKLHWRVQCKVEVSNSAFIRGWAARRLKNAFARKLGQNGFDREGQFNNGPRADESRRESLTGALNVLIKKHDLSLTASKDQVNMSADWIFGVIQERRRGALLKRQRQEKHRPAPDPRSKDL